MKKEQVTQRKAIRIPKQQRSLEKKALICNSAAYLFANNGYDATTTNEIAAHAGISIGTLYSYYADKKAIYSDVLQQFYAISEENLLSPTDSEDLSPWHTIYFMLSDIYNELSSDSGLIRQIYGLSILSNELSEISRLYQPKLIPKLATLFDDHKIWLRDVDIDAAAFIIQNTVLSTLLQAMMPGSSIDPLTAIRELTDFIANYILKQEYLT